MLGLRLITPTSKDKTYAQAALAYKTRVEALGGVIDEYDCLLEDYHDNY